MGMSYELGEGGEESMARPADSIRIWLMVSSGLGSPMNLKMVLRARRVKRGCWIGEWGLNAAVEKIKVNSFR